jgi:hypothetical protein
MNRMLASERIRYLAICEQLRADDPQIDERTLADTVEGLSDYHKALIAIVRAALKDETEAAVLKIMMDEMDERRARFERRAERRRAIVLEEMQHADLTKITAPDFTASIRSNPPHVVVIDEKLIPKEFFEMRPHLRKRDLLEALKAGEQMAGAALSNPAMSLSIRTR